MKPSKFVGRQELLGRKRRQFQMSVDIQSYNPVDQTICGCIRSVGVCDNDRNEVIETLFSGELIGKEHGWISKGDYKSDPETDFMHWVKFEGFRNILSNITTPTTIDCIPRPGTDGRYKFIRLKEACLWSDIRGKKDGVTWEGFYYLCLDHVTSSMYGYYYHENSILFQKVILKQNSKPQTYSEMEFR